MTRRMSQRARAQEIFREMAEAQSESSSAASLTLRREPGREQTECAASAESDLTARVRALYETSAVPVREIAAVAGVSERTIYKYAQKGGWKARYAWADRGGAARRGWPAADAAAPTQFAPANVMPVRGAGGRFIRREDSGQPFARGLKATDPHGAAQARAACAQAEATAAQAQADAAFLQWNESFVDWLRTVRMIDDALTAYQQARRQRRRGWPAELADAREQTLNRLGHIAIDGLQFCQAQTAALLPSYLASIAKS
jgi:hypothetical protein